MIENNYNKLIKKDNKEETFFNYIESIINNKIDTIRSSRDNSKFQKVEKYIEFANQAFKDNVYYIVNKTQNKKYEDLEESFSF